MWPKKKQVRIHAPPRMRLDRVRQRPRYEVQSRSGLRRRAETAQAKGRGRDGRPHPTELLLPRGTARLRGERIEVGTMRSWKFAALVAAAASVVLGTSAVPVASAATPVADWPQYMDNTSHSSAGHEGAITTAAVASLHSVWHLPAGNRVDASVTVVGGRAYVAGRDAVVYAVNAITGALLWQKQLDKGSSTFCPAKGSVGTPAVLADPVTGALTVYAAGAHSLYALDAATGVQRWSRAIGPATASGEALYFNWSSPTVSGGRIFMGLAANCEPHLIRGGLVSLNQHTGAVLHTYYDTPAGTVGGSIWSSAAA